MLTEKQLKDIRTHLEKAQNPVFFFDNDQDGLCSFLLLQRFFQKGRGVAIKSFPDMDAAYFRKVEELNADYVFILDKPVVSKSFFDRAEELNIPVVWIDHHEVQVEIPESVNYYNPVCGKPKSSEPVTYSCWKITQNKEDLWIAVVGCIYDAYLPDFYKEFMEMWPDLGVKAKNAFDVYYKSDIGKLAGILGYGLKDRTTNVVSMLKFLMKAKSPYDILKENPQNHSFHKRASQIYSKYERLMKKTKTVTDNSGKVIFFKYSGDLSISADIANRLMYEFPKKLIIVAKVDGGRVNLSLRGENVKKVFLTAIDGLVGVGGGGHDNAVGGQMSLDKLDEFKERFEKAAEGKI